MQEIMPVPVVIPRLLQERFATAWVHCRIFLFSAPCGCGKTTMAKKLLSRYSVCERSAGEQDFLAKSLPENCEVLLVDDFQFLKDNEQQQALCELIRSSQNLRFVLLSRGKTPGWMMPFQFAGIMESFEMETLLFNRAAVQELLTAYGITKITDIEVTTIWRESMGHPAALAIFCRRLSMGAPLNGTMLGTIRHEIYAYFDEIVYRRMDGKLRRFLLYLAPFEQFGLDIARLVSGDSLAGNLLEQLQQDTSMLILDGPDTFRFHTFFWDFIRWELDRELTVDEKKNLFSRAGLYYELENSLRLALDCYVQSGEHEKISMLLIKNAELHPGVAQYYDLEKYYFSLPRETILRSPVLMAGMSMLCAMCMEYEESDRWYAELQNYTVGRKKSDPEYKLAYGRIVYLDIGLPHRGTVGLLELLPAVLHMIRNKSIQRQHFSVTSTLPSVMNGGKDFCEWSLQDDIIYVTLHKVLEAVLGADGVGILECGICESKFEKDVDYQPKLLNVMAKLTEIQRHGIPDTEFVAVGLLARVQLAQGKAQNALDTILSLREKFAEQNETRFFPNIDAMLCRIRLYLGDLEGVDSWHQDSALKENHRLWVLWRYQYITKALVQIGRSDYIGALMVSRLLPYTEACSKVMDRIHICIIIAICYYRQGNKAWVAVLKTALDSALKYKFIRPIAEYGVAILPMLTACGWTAGEQTEDETYLNRLIAAVRMQAAYYPNYLKPFNGLIAPLTAAETQVMRLLCNSKSNAELCEILGIALPTAKTHVANVLEKLGVRRRTEVKAVAERLHLL